MFGYLSAGAVFIAFVVAAFAVRAALDRNSAFQTDLRLGHLDRARLLRLQLDEETGVRGYAATRAQVFLEPYRVAVRAFPTVASSLTSRLRDLSVDPSPVQEEMRLNQQWLRNVARPLISNPSTANSAAVQLLGKRLVDRFREVDLVLMAEIDAAAQRSEASTGREVSETFVVAILVGAALALLLTWLSASQRRLAGDLELSHQAYLEEKRIADALQEAFLQKRLPHVADADLHAVYVPAGRESRVGGDWYDAFELSDDRILFSIGDVAGHGIDAAVVMSRVRQAILSVGIDESDPANVLSRANEILLMQDATIVTAICGVVDLAQGVIRMANAGHPPGLMLFDGQRVEKIGATGPPLGAVDHASYTVTSMLAAPGSILTLYTDGLIEYDRDWDAGELRVLEVLRAIHGEVADPAAALLQKIFNGEAPPDDVAILTIAFRENTRESGAERAGATQRAHPILRRDFHALLAS
jgi:serine phosphatase RsbU (regulator of sigma subunit)